MESRARLTVLRSKISGAIYRGIIKNFLFLFEPELVHNWFIRIGRVLGSNVIGRGITKCLFSYQDWRLEQELLGIKFRNPIGLSAGFDKNAEMMSIIGDVGFGFSEVGSITAKGCSGNEGKRMKRIIDRRALWINLGLNNRGVDKLIGNFEKKQNIPIGINVAKTNSQENADVENGINDYIYTLKKLNERKFGDYYVLNISCPNAFGGLPFHKPKLYVRLLKKVKALRLEKPVFVKLSPDIEKRDVDKILEISGKYGVKGFICSNLTKESGKSGGYSGKMLSEKADEQLKYVYERTKGKFVLIGVGGVFNAEDAYRKIKLGASLVELITGMIYEGPGLIGEINLGLVKLMARDGYKNIGEAVGKLNK